MRNRNKLGCRKKDEERLMASHHPNGASCGVIPSRLCFAFLQEILFAVASVDNIFSSVRFSVPFLVSRGLGDPPPHPPPPLSMCRVLNLPCLCHCSVSNLFFLPAYCAVFVRFFSMCIYLCYFTVVHVRAFHVVVAPYRRCVFCFCLIRQSYLLRLPLRPHAAFSIFTGVKKWD